MALKAVVVAVRMQQRVVVGDAEGGDQSIDGLADRHSLTTKSSVIPRRGDSNFATLLAAKIPATQASPGRA